VIRGNTFFFSRRFSQIIFLRLSAFICAISGIIVFFPQIFADLIWLFFCVYLRSSAQSAGNVFSSPADFRRSFLCVLICVHLRNQREMFFLLPQIFADIFSVFNFVTRRKALSSYWYKRSKKMIYFSLLMSGGFSCCIIVFCACLYKNAYLVPW